MPKPTPIVTPLPPQTAGATVPPGAKPTVAIYMLSKGRGVPEPTREAYRRIRSLLEQQQAAGNVSDISTRRLGIEGETRLCAQFTDTAQAQAALRDIRKLASGVELLNVVEEPCANTKGDPP